jgi:PAS domain S-box-containing protein
MASLVSALDWSATPLGPRDAWPQSLRTAVGICLDSQFPMNIWWGPQLVQVYNDAYRPVLGDKHPRSLGQRGQECWAEIWPVVGPLCEQVLCEGKATWSSDLLLEMDRHGYLEETYFTFSYSPIRDESGSVGGVLITCFETTPSVIGARRLVALRDLGALSSRASTAEEACSLAAEVLAEHTIDVPFAHIWLIDEATGASTPPGAADAPWAVAEAVRTRQPMILRDVRARAGDLPGGPWPVPPEEAVVIPIGGAGSEPLVGVLVAGVSPRRRLDDEQLDFLRLVAGHIASNVASARAYEAERRRAEALAEIDRAKTAFFGNVSHEFRTPLTLMMGPLQEALEDVGRPLDPAHRERVNVAHRNSLRLLRLVNTLLDFSRIEAGRADSTFEPKDLATLTAEIASTFRSTIERAGLSLDVDCEPLPEPIWVDGDMWEKVVLNLLSNAYKFTFAGSVGVRLTWADGEAVLEVTDTGVGIPDTDLPHLFTRFHRVRGQASRTHEGTGIGLALVHELVRLHGGRVHVRSEVGRGTTFRVTLPAGNAHLDADRIGARRQLEATRTGARPYVEEAERWLTPAEVTSEMPADHGLRVLVADDNADMLAYVSRLLSERWTVEAVSNGREALAAARRHRPDLVLADVMMPGLDGFELLRALRDESGTADVPVVLLSARAGEESRVDGLHAGADDYLVKPFTARELVARVGAHLERARSHRFLRELFDQAPAMMALLRGPDHRFELVNEPYADSVGRTRKQLLGRPVAEVFPEIVGQGFLHLLDGVYSSGEPYVGRDAQLRLSGGEDAKEQRRWYNFVYQPVRGAGGAVDGVLVHAVDVTARHLEEEQLRQAQRMEAVGTLAGGVAHEVNNMMTAVIGFGEYALRQSAPDNPLRTEITAMVKAGKHAANVTQQLLAFSRRQVLKTEVLDVNAVVGEVARMLTRMLGSDVTLVLEMRARPGRIEGDRGQLEQVLVNVALNARDAMPNGGRLTLRTEDVRPGGRSGPTWTRIVVEDTGVGMDEDTRSRAFEPFFTTKAVGSGTGLGLSTVFGIVTQSGGDVQIESEPGRGTTVLMSFPTVADAPAPHVEKRAEPRSGAVTVLLVEDEDIVRHLAWRILDEAGFAVIEARNGREALERMEEHPDVRLVLTDLVMPEMGGRELGRAVRERWPAVPVLYMSGYSGAHLERQGAIERGAPFLQKPFGWDALLREVRSLLDGSSPQPAPSEAASRT